MMIMGALIGFLVSISSVGAGAIGAMGLILLYPQMPLARIVGSDIAHAVPLTFVAGIGYWWLGSTDWRLLAGMEQGRRGDGPPVVTLRVSLLPNLKLLVGRS